MSEHERLISQDAAVAYWKQRHATGADWASGGDRGLSEAQNKVFYELRLAMILRALLDHFGPARSVSVLDAGCGRGWLSGQLAECGYAVTGIDVSHEAIERAQAQYPARFLVSPLDTFTVGRRFGAIVCMDVLFHILDDGMWANTLLQLAAHLEGDGVLLITDDIRPARYTLGDYIVHRSEAEYAAVLNSLNLRRTAELPYNMFGNPNTLYAYTRI